MGDHGQGLRNQGWYTAAMERLVVVVQELSLARNLASIQQIVRHAARQLISADGATFVLRDGDRCHYADEDAIHPLWKGQRFPMSSCISGWAMLNRQPAVIEDIYQDPRIPHEAYRPTFVKSLAMVPIRTRDPIGAIGVYWAAPHCPDAEEVRLIQALADTTAVAMENVTIQGELEERVRERTAEALAAKDDAERANALKARFLSTANHDLRQPLQSIGSYLSVLSGHAENAEVRSVCDKARGAVRSMGGLLDTMLDLDRLQSGTVTPAVQDFAILDLARQVVAGNRLHAHNKGLRLEVAGDEYFVRSDPALLARVLDNLVSNALRYTPHGTVTVRCTGGDGRARVSVSDTGTGIPEGALDRVFDEGVQLDNPAHDRARGLGLGLSIVRQLARVLGHDVTVTSKAGAGSTFCVELPLGRPPPAAAPAGALPAASARDLDPVVLLVEDDDPIADAALMMLNAAGISVRHARECGAALAQLADGFRPNLLLMDYSLPRGTGVDAVRRLREALGAEVPAVILTGDTSLKPHHLGNVSGCMLLHKPIDGEELVGLIRSLVRRPEAA